jgi:hypothetical protein
MKKLLLTMLLIPSLALAAGASPSTGLIAMLGGNVGMFWINGTPTKALLFGMDMPRTFDSSSCIASGGMLLYVMPKTTWYCWEQTFAKITELEPD